MLRQFSARFARTGVIFQIDSLIFYTARQTFYKKHVIQSTTWAYLYDCSSLTHSFFLSFLLALPLLSSMRTFGMAVLPPLLKKRCKIIQLGRDSLCQEPYTAHQCNAWTYYSCSFISFPNKSVSNSSIQSKIVSPRIQDVSQSSNESRRRNQVITPSTHSPLISTSPL